MRHREVGAYARERGIERLFAVGALSRGIAEGFGAGALHYEALPALCERLRDELAPEVNLLVKASRSMGLERVVADLEPDSGVSTEPAGAALAEGGD